MPGVPYSFLHYDLVSAGTTGEHGEAQRATLLVVGCSFAARARRLVSPTEEKSCHYLIMHALRVLAVFLCDFATADSILVPTDTRQTRDGALHPPKELIIHSPSFILPTHCPVLKRTQNWVLPVKSREIRSTDM